MQNFLAHEIAISSDDLFHDADSGGFCEALMFFDEGIEGALRAVLKYEVVEVVFVDDVVALDDVGVFELAVNGHFLF